MPTVEICINIFRHLTDRRFLAFWALGFHIHTHQTLIISSRVVSYVSNGYLVQISNRHNIKFKEGSVQQECFPTPFDDCTHEVGQTSYSVSCQETLVRSQAPARAHRTSQCSDYSS